jgi:hypothetical protein
MLFCLGISFVITLSAAALHLGVNEADAAAISRQRNITEGSQSITTGTEQNNVFRLDDTSLDVKGATDGYAPSQRGNETGTKVTGSDFLADMARFNEKSGVTVKVGNKKVDTNWIKSAKDGSLKPLISGTGIKTGSDHEYIKWYEYNDYGLIRVVHYDEP